MKLNAGLALTLGSLLAAQSSISLAQEGETATVRLSHGVLKYSSSVTKTTVAGTSGKAEVTAIDTFPAGIEIATFVKGYALYVYPVQQNGASVWLGKALNPNLEVGATAMLSSNKVKNGAEKDKNSIGAYLWWSTALTPTMNFETNINPALVFGSGKTLGDATATPPSADSKSDISGYSLYFDALGVIPLAKNFEYAFGLSYDLSKETDEAKASGVTTKTETDFSSLGIVLAKFRYSI